jgi:hypothetical protein
LPLQICMPKLLLLGLWAHAMAWGWDVVPCNCMECPLTLVNDAAKVAVGELRHVRDVGHDVAEPGDIVVLLPHLVDHNFGDVGLRTCVT